MLLWEIDRSLTQRSGAHPERNEIFLPQHLAGMGSHTRHDRLL
jgi:hypothetical protein